MRGKGVGVGMMFSHGVPRARGVRSYTVRVMARCVSWAFGC